MKRLVRKLLASVAALSVLVSVVGSMSVFAGYPEEILYNTDFEIAGLNGRTWYKVPATHSDDAKIDNSQSHYGMHSLRLAYTNPNSAAGYSVEVKNAGVSDRVAENIDTDYGWIPVDTQKAYRFSFWLKAERANTLRKIDVKAECYSGKSGSTLVGSFDLLGQIPLTEWREYTYILSPDLFPDNTKYMRFSLKALSGLEGCVWVDDCSVTTVPTFEGNLINKSTVEWGGWTTVSGQNYTYDDNVAYTGIKSLRINSNGTNEQQTGTNNYFNTTGTELYEVSAWVKSSKNNVGSLDFVFQSGYLEDKTAKYTKWKVVNTIIPTTEWKKYSCIVDASDPQQSGFDSTVSIVRVNLYSKTEANGGLKAGEHFWVDDLTVRKISSTDLNVDCENVYWTNGTAQPTYDEVEKHSGNKSLTMTASGSDEWWVAANKYVKWDGKSEKYNLSVWLKASEDNAGEVSLVLHTGRLNDDNYPVWDKWKKIATFTPDSTWREYTLEIDTKDVNTYGVDVTNNIFRPIVYTNTVNKGGLMEDTKLWVDDLKIVGFANTADEYAHISKITPVEGGYKVDTQFFVKDNTDSRVPIAAVYDVNGRVKAVQVSSEDIVKIGTTDVTFNLSCDHDNKDYVRLYLWNSFKNIKPMTDDCVSKAY